jgi:hypothetical protein
MEAINIKVYPTNNSQVEALKAVIKAFNIKFELVKEKPYNPEFVEKILQGDEDFKAGKGRKVTLEELNALWK